MLFLSKNKIDIDKLMLFIIVGLTYVLSGGYFQSVYSIFTALIALLAIYIKVKTGSKTTLFSAVVAIMVLICIISTIFFADNIHLSILELPKYFALFFALMLFSDKRARETGYCAVIFFTFIAAVCGIISYVGLARAFDWTLINNGRIRLQSFLQYANSMAAMLGAGLFLFYSKTKRIKGGITILSLLITAFFMTDSIGAMICTMYAYVACFLFCKKKNEMIPLGAMLLVCGVLFFIAGKITLSGNMVYLIVKVTIITTVTAFVGYATSKLFKKEITFSRKASLVILVLFTVFGFFAGIMLALKSGTFLERLISDIDALKLLSKNIFGIGGGNWSFMQYAVRRIEYTMKYVHCGYIQIALDGGIIAGVMFIVLVVICVANYIRNNDFTLDKTVKFGALLLCLSHLIVDIDFNFLIFIILFALVAAEGDKPLCKHLMEKACCCGLVVLSIASSVYAVYDDYMQTKIDEKEDGYNFTAAENVLDKKLLFQPFDSDALVRKSQYVEIENRSKAQKLIENAINKNPKNQRLCERLFEFEKRGGLKYRDQVNKLENLTAGCVVNKQLYSELIQLYIKGLKNGELDAETFKNKGQNVYSYIENVNQKKGILKYFSGKPLDVDAVLLTELFEMLQMSNEELKSIADENLNLKNEAAEKIAAMSVEDKAWNLIICSFDEAEKEGDRISQIGGIILGEKECDTPNQTKEYTDFLKIRYNSPFIAVKENSDTSTIRRQEQFNLIEYAPRNYFKNYEYDNKAYELGKSVGKVLNENGIDMCMGLNLSSVQNPNAFYYNSSFSSSVDETNDIIKKYVSGIQSENISTVGEQFPAYANITDNPQEKAIASDYNYERRRQNIYSGVRAVTERHIDFIMMSHLLVPQTYNAVVNSEFSKSYVTGILRNELGFDGLIMTDDLSAASVTSNIGIEQGAIYAINAGCDMIYVSQNVNKVVQGIIQGINNGTISENRVNNALENIFKIKEKKEKTQ